MQILIPAYQPTELLPRLVADLLVARPSVEILVVDDGSDPSCSPVFAECEALGTGVLRLAANRGKGYALRAGFAHLHELRVTGPVVTADADGQHAVADILKVGDAVDGSVGAEPHLVLGERQFDVDVPLRSRFGNAATRLMFRAATGRRLHDTQTGLRAFPADLLPWLATVRGDRYEFELVMLLRAARQGIAIRSESIRTIYLDDNSSSHFRPVADSVRIYAPLLTFVASSLAAFALDTAVLLALHAVLGSLFGAVVGARLISGAANFALNRHFVFPGAAQSSRASGLRYAGLATALLAANYLLLSTLYAAGLALLPAKVLTEVVLVSVSYLVQARFVFSAGRRVVPAGRRTRAGSASSAAWPREGA